MSRSPQLRLEDIVEACEQVAGYVEGYDAARFSADDRVDCVQEPVDVEERWDHGP